MERFWKWLMHANARALFVFALLILLLVLGWSAWVIWRPRAAVAAPLPAAPPPPPAAISLGILAFLSNELAVGAQIVTPVCPFRPTLEALAALTGAARTPVAVVTPSTNADPFAALRPHRRLPIGHAVPPPPTLRVPRVTYRGYFQRPDGKFAALFSDSTAPAPAFHLPGETFRGITLLDGNATRVRVRMPGGEERNLAKGEYVELPAEASP